MLYLYIALMVQTIVAVAVFDKISYLYVLVFFSMAALACHLQMHWAWQLTSLTVGILCELAVYQADVWQEITNPFKLFTKRSIVLAVILSVFCIGFIYQSAAIVKLDLFTWKAFFYWIVIFYVLVACAWGAINITDYLSLKTVVTCKLKVNNVWSKNIPRIGVIHYLNATANGTDYKFVVTDVAYSVLRKTNEITVNLWQAYSGEVFIKNDFLREERRAWRVIQFKTTLLILALIIVIIGVVYYLSK